jgi:TonB family protein
MGRFDLNMIPPSGVEGIEVYPHGVAVPAELAGSYGMERCGLIAIWSRPMRPNVRADQLPPEHPENLDSLLAANVVYTAKTVDRPVTYVDGTAQPVYPDSLSRARVAGSVMARFVVDTLGRVEAPTIHIDSATAPAFGEAVHRALLKAMFEPARLNGRRVRQVVEMPFDFKPPAADSASTGGASRIRPGYLLL